MSTATSAFRCFPNDDRGVSAVEFALILPVMLLIYLGGFQVTQIASVYRKVSLTTHTVADLATQYTTMSTTDMNNVLGASAQVMTPFSTSTLSIVLTEFSVNAAGVATVTWSKALNGAPLQQGSIVVLQPGLAQINTSVVVASVSYSYMPPIGYKMTGPILMSDRLYMSPRQINSIPYTGT